MSGNERATWDGTWERCTVCPAPIIPDVEHEHLPDQPARSEEER